MSSRISEAVSGSVEMKRLVNDDVLNACHRCHSGNRDDSKFCQSCGSPLFQACPSCAASNRIGQFFCSGCGFHIVAEIQQKLAAAEERLADAKRALDALELPRAAEVLRSLQLQNDDWFMDEIRQQADTIAAEVESCRLRWDEKIQVLTEQARQSSEQLAHARVISTVDSIPEHLVPAELRKLRKQSRHFLDKQQELRQSLKAAIKTKDYIKVGYSVEELLALKPHDGELQTLSKQVSEVLIKSATASFNSSRYADAFAYLSAIPAAYRDTDEYQGVKGSIDDAVWITEQIARSPFATKPLGLLAKRLGTMAPSDTRVAKVVNDISARLKTGSDDPHSLYPRWTGTSKGWGDASVTIAGSSKRITLGDHPDLVRNPTRYMVAIGLALHAIGETKFHGFPLKTKGLTSVFSRLSKKVPIVAWGIDCGASAVRAIKLERQGERLAIADAVWLPLPASSSRARGSLRYDSFTESEPTPEQLVTLQRLAERIGIDAIPVWANVPSRDVLGRFFSLPPLAERKLSELLENEIATQFPLPPEQLTTAAGITGTGAGGSPRGTIVACKKETIEKRERVFIDAGIKLAGLLPDPVALHHYVAYEWKDLMESGEASETSPSVAVLDAGATGSTLYVGSKAGFWFRHHGFGGDDLTSVVASECNLTRQKAEAARIEPSKLTPLAPAMEAMERRMESFAFRIGQSAADALQSLDHVQLTHIFCTGGTSLQHGWTRHVITSRVPSLA